MKVLRASALTVFLLLCAVLMLNALSLRAAPVRGGGGGAAGRNGDVNCDGRIDIADAISIIQWQLLGGPGPCAFAQDAGIQDLITEVKGLRADLAAKGPPKPENLVKLVWDWQSTVLYTVPADKKYFIVTNIDKSSTQNVGLTEKTSQGKSIVMWPVGKSSYSSAVGMAIPSGSSIEISATGGTGEQTLVISGYLIDP